MHINSILFFDRFNQAIKTLLIVYKFQLQSKTALIMILGPDLIYTPSPKIYQKKQFVTAPLCITGLASRHQRSLKSNTNLQYDTV